MDDRNNAHVRTWLYSIHEQFQAFKKSLSLHVVVNPLRKLKDLNRFLAFVLVFGFLCATSSAIAGDIYFRGSIALDRYNDTVFMDSYCPTGTPAALYGCGTGSDGFPYRAKGGFDQFQSVEFGLGLSTRSNLRFEFLVEYQPSVVFSGDTNFLPQELQQSVSAELSVISSMFTGYLDFPQANLVGNKKLVPFIGAGFGITRNEIDTTTMNFPVTTTVVPGGTQMSITWMASLGMTIELSTKAKIDLGLRYTDLSRVRTARGEGSVSWLNGSRSPLLLDLARTEAELEGFSLRLSFRYSP